MVETCTVTVEHEGEIVSVSSLGAFNTEASKLREGVADLVSIYIALSDEADEELSLGDFTLWLIAQCAEEMRVNANQSTDG